MNYFYFNLILLFFVNISTGQTFEQNQVYVLGFGDPTKYKVISEDFNIENKKMTHVAIGYVIEGEFIFFDIGFDGGKDSKIVKHSWEEFDFNDYSYLGIWSFEINKEQLVLIKEKLHSLIEIGVSYNYTFNLTESNKIYCSQLVAECLNQTTTLKFKPTEKTLNNKYKSWLMRDTLIYYPVDFFLKTKQFKLIYEKQF